MIKTKLKITIGEFLKNTLHIIDVLGGWVGASFAHWLLNHKATKSSFRGVFYMTIIVNIFLGVMIYLV